MKGEVMLMVMAAMQHADDTDRADSRGFYFVVIVWCLEGESCYFEGGASR